jgi:hypothetical protein
VAADFKTNVSRPHPLAPALNFSADACAYTFPTVTASRHTHFTPNYGSCVAVMYLL